jgi:hypothetical protein
MVPTRCPAERQEWDQGEEPLHEQSGGWLVEVVLLPPQTAAAHQASYRASEAHAGAAGTTNERHERIPSIAELVNVP